MHKRQFLGAGALAPHAAVRRSTENRAPRRYERIWALAVATALLAGCNESSSRPTTGAAKPEAMSARGREDTFRYAANLLNNADTLNADPERKEKQSSEQSAARLIYGNTPPIVIEQLNRWLMTQKPAEDWRREPLLEGLPKDLRALKSVENLDDLRFTAIDGAALREAVWLRDISDLACGDAVAAVDRAERLFDWVVRNIQLDPPPQGDAAAPLACLPWHALLLGRGQPADRAWLFVLLARQQGLDVVVLKPAEAKQAMLLGLLHASEKEGSQLYLFDAQLGLPIPGPDSQNVATLAQVAQDDQWLRKLDLDAEHPYPLHASDFEKLTAEIEASPLYLQQRALLVEAKLSGDQKLELSVEPSALAKRLKAIPQIDKAELWPLPFERLKALADRKSPEVKRLATELEPFVVQFPYQKKKDISLVPILWRARVRHLVGDFTGESGANHYYQLVRLPDAEIELATEAHGAELQKITDPQLKAQLAQASQRQLQLLRIVKQDASYWLGLVAFERANYATARDYFEKRTLEPSPDGPWTAGAWYNLGRTYEALGKRKEAIAAYRNDQSPQRHGSMLRARRLEGESPQGESPKADAASQGDWRQIVRRLATMGPAAKRLNRPKALAGPGGR